MTDTDRTLAWGDLRVALEPTSYSDALFLATIERRGYTHMRSKRRTIGEATSDELLSLLRKPSFASVGGDRTKALIEMPGLLVSVDVHSNVAGVNAAGNDPAALARAVEDVINRFPKRESPQESTPINFWSELNGTGDLAFRGLEPRRWSEISGSYASTAGEELDSLMSRSSAPSGGRLILWHGEPGTGKTNALRALAHEWREWCSVHLITDPDRFIGDGMNYMLSVLTMKSLEGPTSRRQKLLVLEDAGELLSVDARRQSGQGLSRLLNLSYGLLGIGMNTITLITTNEPLGRLHPAVHRPGRCLAEIEFTPLDVDESTQWLERHGSREIVTEPKTLAQLYAILEGRDQGVRRTPVGFT